MSESIVLAIETSQRVGGVALRTAEGRIHEQTFGVGQRHDDALMPTIERLCREAGVRSGEIAAIGVDIGPGGFTGLRIAIATAKCLAEVTGARLAAVPGAMVAAASYGGRGPVLVASACKGSSFWLTRLERDAAGHWDIAGEPALVEAEAFDPSHATTVLADAHFPEQARQRCHNASVPIDEPTFAAPACLRAAERLIEQGRFVDPLRLEPIYPRPPEAVSLWQKRMREESANQRSP